MQAFQLNTWKFHLGEEPEAFHKRYDDAAWREVSVPHDWSVELPFSRENSSGTGYLSGGIGWYRAAFTLERYEAGKRVFLHFDGVYKYARVWVNGYYLGERPNGYIGFGCDITHCLHVGRDNVVAVRADHRELTDSRWFTGSGIYRKVTVSLEEAVYLPEDEIFFTAAPVTGEDLLPGRDAAITVGARAINTTDAPVKATVRAVLEDDGKPVLSLEESIDLPADNCGEVALTGILPNPVQWSPENPKLYTLRCTVTAGAVQAEAAPIQVGIRSARFDPDDGFFLNGQSRKLKGVCVHHDAGCLGAAVYPEVWRRRLENLKEAGCNAIRMSHNPHMPELYDLCDELGFLAMDEAFDEWEGPKNKWTRGHNVYPPAHQGYAADFPQWHERDLSDMVRQHRNHPSIILWSVGNEIDYPNDPYAHPLFDEMTGNNDANKPSAERMYSPDKPNAERLNPIAAELVDIVRRTDPTRPALIASAFPELTSQTGLFEPFRVMGYNYKEHLYQEHHKRMSGLSLLGSENGHGMGQWMAVRDNDYISGQFLWTGIDYLGEARGWPIRGSGAGILDLAGFPKPAWYRRQGMWSDTPCATLMTRTAPADGSHPQWPWEVAKNWCGVPGQPQQVVLYTNLDEAELFLGEESLGKQIRPNDREYLLWTVPFRRESLSVKASGALGAAEDTLLPALPGVWLETAVWQPKQTPAAFAARYPGLRQVEIRVLDENGSLCVNEAPMIKVEVDGGRLLGLESGDLSDCTDYSSPMRRAWGGTLLAYVMADGDAEPVVAASFVK